MGNLTLLTLFQGEYRARMVSGCGRLVQPLVGGERGQFLAVGNAQLAEDAVAVVLRGLLADQQASGECGRENCAGLNFAI